MKPSIIPHLFIALLLCIPPVTHAAEELDAVSQRYIEMLSNGGPRSIRNTAKSMYRTGESKQQVLDVAAEVLLRDYKNDSSSTVIDAMAWITKAMTHAKTDRYQPVLQEVAKNAGHRKLAGYAQEALNKGLPSDKPYTKGTVNLTKVAKKTAAPAPAAAAAKPANGNFEPISVVREGMNMQDVYNLVGPPTHSYQRQTGKAWKPFNFGGKDVVRQIALYKGQGRIEFSLVSTYSNVWQVVDVLLDESETGYP